MRLIKRRELVSFDGLCPYLCKHCYTLGNKTNSNNSLSINNIVNSLHGKDFDVVYVSHNRENFLDPFQGIELCKRIYSNYGCNILAITRSAFSNEALRELKKLSSDMSNNGRLFFLAVSIPATTSWHVTERPQLMPSPKQRVDFLKRASSFGLITMLTIRPLYPQNIIPIEEPLQLITECKDYVNCVLSSGLAVNETILRQLNLSKENFTFSNSSQPEYLVGAIEGDVKYVDVVKELLQIEALCKSLKLPFFEHSMFALNYFAEQQSSKGIHSVSLLDSRSFGTAF